MIGERLKRIEDPALLRGASVFVDDIHLAGMLQAAFLRSPHPHAKILSIDTTTAQTLSGVHAVYTLADLSPHLLMDRLPLQFPTTAFRPDVTPWILARDEVCHVGEAVAMVIADTRYIAEDAATLIDVQYDPLPSVAGCVQQRLLKMRLRCIRAATRMCWYGLDNPMVTLTQLLHQPHMSLANVLYNNRGAAHPIEGRGALARYDALDGSTTLWSSTQMSHEVRSAIVQMFGIDEGRIRVVAPDVGGGLRLEIHSLFGRGCYRFSLSFAGFASEMD